jgi:tRNA threonylcarbamoyladenosine biosynthesis protein TsaE
MPGFCLYTLTKDFAIITKSPEETQSFGSDFTVKLKTGDVVALYGDLGSGKTQLVKGICLNLGVKQVVNSPTFIIVNEYSSEKFPKIFHFDFYRMKSYDEIIQMGFEDYLKDGNILLIEWPEHIEIALPPKTIKIHIAHSTENEQYRYLRLEMPGN